jgi:hypothetical protein
MSAQHTLGPIADDALQFSVWRETRIIPRRRLAAFRSAGDAINFAELRADCFDETVDTTIWMKCSDGTEMLFGTHPPKHVEAIGSAA